MWRSRRSTTEESNIVSHLTQTSVTWQLDAFGQMPLSSERWCTANGVFLDALYTYIMLYLGMIFCLLGILKWVYEVCSTSPAYSNNSLLWNDTLASRHAVNNTTGLLVRGSFYWIHVKTQQCVLSCYPVWDHNILSVSPLAFGFEVLEGWSEGSELTS